MSDSPQLIMLPGIGTDERLFEPQKAAFPEAVVPPWIPPKRHERLADYGARMAATIRPTGPFLLVGMSFGGAMMLEMAHHLRPEAVVLIASCRSRRQLSRFVQAHRPVVRLIPPMAFACSKPFLPLTVGVLGPTTPENRRLCMRMFRDCNPAWMKWQWTAILNWESRPLDDIPVYHIHGQADRIIPAKYVTPDQWVPGGGHVINLTHADEVNAFLQKAVDVVQLPNPFTEDRP